jgi:hypothetical protein
VTTRNASAGSRCSLSDATREETGMPSHQQLPKKLSIGIAMVFMANLIPLILLLVVAGGHWRPHWWPEILLAIHALLNITGCLLCLTARRVVKGTVYLFISIVTSTSLLFIVGLVILLRVPASASVAACLSLLPSTLFFIMFLRRIAVYLKRADLRVLAGSMIFPAALGLIFAVTAIVPFINLLTIPITTMFLCITYALFLLLTYRTYRAVVEMDNRTADDDVASQMEQHL